MDASTYEGNDLEVLADMPNYYKWMTDIFAPHIHGVVIEYGAGVGTVSSRLLPFADSLTLVEPSENLISQLRERFVGIDNVQIAGANLETHVANLEPNSVDTIVLVNVLEHIEDDRKAVQGLMAGLRPGGHLLLFVPALQFLMSKLDRSIGHFRRYHKPDLIEKVTQAGGKILSCTYFDLVGVLPWLVFNKILRKTKFDPGLIGINDRYVIPVSRSLESVVVPPFGKNLILVARKP